MPKIAGTEHIVGEFKPVTVTTPPDGWLVCNGQTIGSAASGATQAQGYLQDLFSHLWTNYSNTQLIIQTSAGSNTTRGASAAADFAANKRMPLPNLVGHTLIGSGTYTDTVAGSTTRNLGDTVGAASHTLTTAQLPGHTHTGTTGGVSANHTHSVPQGAYTGSTNAFGQPGDTFQPGTQGFAAPQTTGGISSDHTHTVTTDSGAGLNGATHNNMQPSHVINWLIRY
jgi:microcystin-dependent protein